jgi:DNA-binding Lrp family transcriptional regulator
MEKIDLKDRKILYHLGLDSRQSYRSIGKKVGLSKDVVASRVKKLQDKKIIKGCCAVVDYSKLGYSFYRFYFSYQNVSPELKNEIIDYFVNDKNTDSVRSLEGSYDLIVFIYVKSFPDAQTFWHKTLKKYGKFFSKKVFSAYCKEDYYGHRFLLLDEKDINKKIIYQFYDSGKRIEIDDLDFKIVQLISQNSRISTIDMAKELDTTSTIVHYRLKKLMDTNIIIGFTINVNLPKIGYYWYKVDIELNQFDKLSKIINYIEANPNLFYIFGTIGYVDLEIIFALNNSYQLHQIMEDLLKKFPDVIKNYSYTSVIKTHKAYGI